MKYSNSVDTTGNDDIIQRSYDQVTITSMNDVYNIILENTKHKNNNLVIHYINKYIDSINWLDCIDNEGSSILHWCSWLNNNELLKYILFDIDNKPDINAVNKRGESVLEWCIRCNSSDILYTIVQFDAKYNGIANWQVTNNANGTLLHIAACENNIKITQCLLLCNIDIDAIDIYGNTALHNSIQRQQYKQFKLLLQHNACTTILSLYNTSLLHVAAMTGSITICNDLIRNGCSIYLNALGTSNNLLPETIAEQNNHTLLARQLKRNRLNQNSIYKRIYKTLFVKTTNQTIIHNNKNNTNNHIHQSNNNNNNNRVDKRSLTTVPQLYYFIAIIGTMTHFYISGIQTELMLFDTTIQFQCIMYILYLSYILSVVTLYLVSRILPGYALHDKTQHTQYNLMLSLLQDISVCITCRVIRPLRSKHDNQLNGCILRYDHWCPWVNNVVGQNNHRLFVIGLGSFNICATLYTICIAYYIMLPISGTIEQYNIALFLALHCTLINICVAVLFISQCIGICNNLTTNETINRTRYNYLVDNSINVFDQGIVDNCLIFWGYRQQRHIDIPFITYEQPQLKHRYKHRHVFDKHDQNDNKHQYTAVNKNEINNITSVDSVAHLDTVIDIHKTS